MKVHQFTRGIFWEHEPSLTLGCKRLRPLAPKLNSNDNTSSIASFDLKSFIRTETKGSSDDNNNKRDLPSPTGQVETHNTPGGTRWNPTPEQIGVLEMLYKGGMRTPNAHQIEQITVQLGKYGKIEGKNVFYWFQNHKARERQKQKRHNSLVGLSHRGTTATNTTTTTILSPPTFITATSMKLEKTTAMGEVVERDDEDVPYKKCRNWAFEYMEDQSKEDNEEEHKTLELFPLHPEGR